MYSSGLQVQVTGAGPGPGAGAGTRMHAPIPHALYGAPSRRALREAAARAELSYSLT